MLHYIILILPVLYQSIYQFIDTRIIDPDQAFQRFFNFETINYVRYNPGYKNYTCDYEQNLALAYAIAKEDYNLFFSIASVNPKARVSHYEDTFAVGDPEVAYNGGALSSGEIPSWLSYGGAFVEPYPVYDNISHQYKKMSYGDEVLNVAFYYESIQPGMGMIYSCISLICIIFLFVIISIIIIIIIIIILYDPILSSLYRGSDVLGI